MNWAACFWLVLVIFSLVGQVAWVMENMYFNVFLYNTISTDPGYIASMVAWSAAAATLTTLVMGALSDRVGKRKLFICAGYILWGLFTIAFGAVEFLPKNSITAAAVLVVAADAIN